MKRYKHDVSVYGCVTNNNGVWDWMIGFIDHSFTITLNHNQLQELTINLQPNSSSWNDEDSLHFRSLSVLYYFYSLEAEPQKTPLPLLLYLQRRCIATEIIPLLPAYSLPRECVYRVAA
jgi:hypothetical protein